MRKGLKKTLGNRITLSEAFEKLIAQKEDNGTV